MSFDLLNINFLLALFGLVCIFDTYLFISLTRPYFLPAGRKRKPPPKLATYKRLGLWSVVLLLSGLLLAFLLKALIGHWTGSLLPSSFIIETLPTTVAVGLIVLVGLRRHMVSLLMITILALSLVFSLAAINNYYRYYPTLGTLLGQTGAQNLAKQSKVTLKFNLNTAPVKAPRTTVESALTSIQNQSTKGSLYKIDIPAVKSGFKARSGYVYVPAIYNTPPNIDLPVVVLTAGIPGAPNNWVDIGMQKIMDTFAKHHDGITPLIFMVDNIGNVTNDTECVDSPRGNVETYLTVDVPNFIKSHFNVQADASHWAIGGLSLGGTCGVMLTLRHPDIYHYFLDYGGEIAPEDGNQAHTIQTLFGGSYNNWQDHQPTYLLATHKYKGLGGFFVVGSEDQRVVVDAASQLYQASQNAGIESVYETINGHHTFDIWKQAYQQSLGWISNRLGATECQTTCL